MTSFCSLRRFTLACLAMAPGIVSAVIDVNHTLAFAKQARFQQTGKIAKRQEDDSEQYTCTASRGCDIGCCGAL